MKADTDPRELLRRHLVTRSSYRPGAAQQHWMDYSADLDAKLRLLPRPLAAIDSYDEAAFLRLEKAMLYRMVVRREARVTLALLCEGRPVNEAQAQGSAAVLIDWGMRPDVELLWRASRKADLPFFVHYAARLEERLRTDDPMLPATRCPLPIIGAEALCQLWFELHNDDLWAYHYGRCIAANWEGVLAVDADRESVEHRVLALREQHKDFPYVIGHAKTPDSSPARDSVPSRRFSTEVDATGPGSHNPAVTPLPRPIELNSSSALDKVEPALRAKLMRASPAEEIRVIVQLEEDPTLDIGLGSYRRRDPAERRRVIQQYEDRMAARYGAVLRAIDETGVKRIGGEHFTTLVLQGTPDQLVRAFAVDGVQKAFMDRPMTL